MQYHKKQNLSLKSADIDIKMVPVVQWLNSFEGILTLHSCEGGPANVPYTDEWAKYFTKQQYEKQNNVPYVNFVCWDSRDLKKAMEFIQEFDIEYKKVPPIALECFECSQERHNFYFFNRSEVDKLIKKIESI